MNRAIASSLLSLLTLLFPSNSEAAFTDFEALVLGAAYPSGEVFLSDGLSFETVDLLGDSGIVDVQNYLLAGGSGLELAITGGLNFLIPVGTNHVSMRYTLSDPTLGLVINGFPTPIGTKFSLLDGTSVDGVLISTVLNPGQGEQGVLTLDGPISSFVIGGRELWIDDVSVIVPEPSTAMLLFAASSYLLTSRRRRHA